MLLLDVRHATRGLLRRPSFTIIAVLTLALGIGANTAIFSAVWHLMLAPLPFPDGDRMGYLWDSTEAGFELVPSREEAEAFETASRTLDWIEPYSSGTLAWQSTDATETVDAGYIGAGLPSRLAVTPILGRSFSESETGSSPAPVAMVSESFWRTRLGGSPDVVGDILRLDDRPYEVIGVMPDRLSRFRQGYSPREVWLPLDRTAETRLNLLVVHREGVSPAAAGEELTAIAANVPEAKLGAEQPRTVLRMPGDMLGSSTRTALVVLLAAVGLVLLVACANVAGLMLIRASDRQREIAIRAALGADRLAVLRFLLAETTLIAAAGGATGLLAGVWGIDLVRSIRPAWLGELGGISLEPTVLAFAGGITLLTLLLFGLLPSVHSARTDLRSQFATSGRGPTDDRGTSRAGSVLVVVEVALAVVLLVGASLLVRTMAELRGEPLGFDGSGTIRFAVELPVARYADEANWAAFGQQLADEMEALPGAASASLSTGVPPELGVLFAELQAEGSEPTGDRLMFGAEVGPSYFRTMGIDLIEGRAFDGSATDELSIIINRRTAERLWPGESALGKRIRLGTTEGSPWRTVIGVTPDIAVSGPGSTFDQPQVFQQIAFSYPFITGVVRASSGDPFSVLPAIRAAVARIDPALPVRNIASVDQLLAESIGRQRFNMILFSSFAGLALVLATVGLYGVIAFSVTRRTRELGIRAALGATPAGVRGMVIRNGATLAATGTTIGCLVALRLTLLMEDMLHGVAPRDPLSFAAAAVIVTGVALLATWVPARRASRVDPMVALRME